MSATFRRILCPIDFDDNSLAALDLACKLAAENGASLMLMHVVPFPIAATEITLPSDPIPVWEASAQARLERIRAERIPATLAAEIVTRSGVPAEIIVRTQAELDADLTVMATHGRTRSGVGRFFLGSVAEQVIRRALGPVLVVPPRPPG